MSRCFPYDPFSGCEERAALIEQIKLQKQEKAEEKKQKKRAKKHEKVHVLNGMTEDAKQGHLKRKHGERNQVDQKGKGYAMAKCDESEQLEKSGLTEEHDLRYAASTRGQESPDSSQYAKKRKIDAPEINRISHGSLLLRIKVPALTPKEPELRAPQPVSAEQPCFSGRMETAVSQEQRTKIVIEGQDHQRCPVDELNVFKGFCGGKKSRRRESKYTNLFANWDSRPPLTDDVLIDDQDWLFEKSTINHQTEQGTNRCRGKSNLSVSATVLPAWPPRACFLPESNIYALPFLVPF